MYLRDETFVELLPSDVTLLENLCKNARNAFAHSSCAARLVPKTNGRAKRQ